MRFQISSWIRTFLFLYFGLFAVGIMLMNFDVLACAGSWMLFAAVAPAPFVLLLFSIWDWRDGGETKIENLKKSQLTTASKKEEAAIRLNAKMRAVVGILGSLALLLAFGVFLSHGFEALKDSLFLCQ